MGLAAAGASAFLLTLVLVPLVRRFALARRFVAMPSHDRWHMAPLPHVGGIAMVAPVVAVTAAGGIGGVTGLIVAGGVLMFVVGIVDDLAPMRPATKLVWQTVVAALLLWLMPDLVISGRPLLDIALAFAWIVGITNAFNLLDHLDGLAAGVAAIAGLSFLAVLGVAGPGGAADDAALIVAAVAGAATGFLVYNFHPASIFMGDGGSHFIGSVLALATLLPAAASPRVFAPVAAIPVLLLIPIFEMTFVAVTRRLAGREAFRGGRDHTAHRLVALGIGDRQAALILYGLAAGCGVAAVAFVSLPRLPGAILVAVCLAGLAAVGVYLRQVDHGAARATSPVPAGAARATSPVPAGAAIPNRSYEVLLDVVLLSAAYYVAYVLRFREPLFTALWPPFASTFPIVVGLQLAVLWLTGTYRRAWPLGPAGLLRVARGVTLGVAASVIAVLYLTRFEGISRLVFLIDAGLATALVVMARLALQRLDRAANGPAAVPRNVVIFASGRAGRLAIGPSGAGEPAAAPPADVPVAGTLGELSARLDEAAASAATVVIAVETLSEADFEAVRGLCAARGVPVLRVRLSMEQLSDGAGATLRKVLNFPPAGRRNAV